MWYAYTMEFSIKNDEIIKFAKKVNGNRRYYERGNLLSERQTLHVLAATLGLASKP